MYEIINIYITLMSVIMAGIFNMIFTKTKLYKTYKYPIDCYKCINNIRIFGDNKTIIGFISMILLNSISQVIWGYICNITNISYRSLLYERYSNSITYNIIIGAMLGFLYMLCELPNSFIKRRLNIECGKTIAGVKGYIFYIIDQIDSAIGVVILISIIATITISDICKYIVTWAITHIMLNILLYKLNIRRNI